MQQFEYFPALVYRDERPEFVGTALPVCLQILDNIRVLGAGMTQSNHLANIPELSNIACYAVQSSVEILKSQGYDVDKYDFYLSGFWAQEIFDGGTNVHVHKNSQICGWVFLETDEGGVSSVYHDSRTNKQMVELDFQQGSEIKNATNAIYFNNLVAGTVLFSNSWLQHQLIGNSSKPTRCIHFIVAHKEKMCSMC